ncbi:hypothetical protein SAMN04487936_11493 [Halobacillus dabanensis]|uniref:N-acetyltransferase domain-containing protein n=1 Tax=Halobacillus dabanensis TaxID=240302 RepID=A0A1I3ZPZ9_HALDA|nr:hypothetical protein [Halobacillus dabanensis]SFK46182.1 hypothetical protein SAMN04487936_11493 [Halobacillus dabanensis]
MSVIGRIFLKNRYMYFGTSGEIGSRLLAHASKEVAELGFLDFYLSSDLEGYYEKYGWKHEGQAYGVFGDPIKVFQKRSG